MNAGTKLYNRQVERERRIDEFSMKVKVMLISGITIGCAIALAIFVGCVMLACEFVRWIIQ